MKCGERQLSHSGHNLATNEHGKQKPRHAGRGFSSLENANGSEAIIDAEPQHVAGEAGVSYDREVAIAKIDVEVFGLCAPARIERDFHAETRGPADLHP